MEQDSVFRLRNPGGHHRWCDTACPGCESINNQNYPRRHSEFGKNCPGLVHAERVKSKGDGIKIVLICDACFGHPLLGNSDQ